MHSFCHLTVALVSLCFVRAPTAAPQEDDDSNLLQSKTTIDAVSTHHEEKLVSHARARLLIEQDLSACGEARYCSYNQSQPPDENIETAFTFFLDVSGLDNELNPEEKKKYRKRVHVRLSQRFKHQFDPLKWPSAVKKTLEEEKPVFTSKLASYINQLALPYHVQHREWMENFAVVDYNRWRGVKFNDMKDDGSDLESNDDGAFSAYLESATVPSEFESATQFPNCSEVITREHNQGHCGSCWVFAAMKAVESQLCIKAKGTFSSERAQLSRGQATSCTYGKTHDGCEGGWPSRVYSMLKYGSGGGGGVTGGEHGCSPYFGHGAGEEHFQQSDPAPPCPTQCTASYTARPMAEDRFKFTGLTYRDLYRSDTTMISELQKDLVNTGAVAFAMEASSPFLGYSSGVFDADCTTNPNHAVTAVGYGKKTEKTVAYISALNSWGSYWGDNGGFKITTCGVTHIFRLDLGDNFQENVPDPLVVPYPFASTSTTSPSTADGSQWTVKEGSDSQWTVKEGSDCKQEPNSGCIMTENWDGEDGKYGNNQQCVITVGPNNMMKIEVIDFQVEDGFDGLWIQGTSYYKGVDIQGMVPKGKMIWTSDHSFVNSGFKICPKRTNNKPATQPTATTESPTTK